LSQPDTKKEEEPVHIINIALQIEKNCKDVEICRKMVYEFTQSKVKIWLSSLSEGRGGLNNSATELELELDLVLEFTNEGGLLKNSAKNPQDKDENQQQNKPTHDVNSGIRNPGHCGGRRMFLPLLYPYLHCCECSTPSKLLF